jgi:hypothetical protein
VGVRLGLGADPLGLGQPGGDVLGRGTLDVGGDFLGLGEDLLHLGPEVPEGDVGEAGLTAGLRGLLLKPVDLPGHRLDLRVRLLPLAGQRGDLVLGPGDVAFDLLLLVTPQGGLEAGLGGCVSTETEDFPAVRHASHPHIRIVP